MDCIYRITDKIKKIGFVILLLEIAAIVYFCI